MSTNRIIDEIVRHDGEASTSDVWTIDEIRATDRPVPVRLPSGITVVVGRTSAMDLIRQGLIPEDLRQSAMRLLALVDSSPTEDIDEAIEKDLENEQALNAYVSAMVRQPKMSPDDAKVLPITDRYWLFSVLRGVAEVPGLNRFPERPGTGDESAPDGNGLRPAPLDAGGPAAA